MTLSSVPDTTSIDPARRLQGLPYQGFPNPHNPFYGALTQHPGDSWANGGSWLIDSVTGYAFCPIEPGKPGPLIDSSGEWLSEVIETGLTP